MRALHHEGLAADLLYDAIVGERRLPSAQRVPMVVVCRLIAATAKAIRNPPPLVVASGKK
ncbi:MAG: hypothetical protein KF764_08590 [Labilithrix sp.]|nr:hypothetical protein [Labilithrix sp.]